jgi:predicted enzyme related to lactoylglutathione lyase
MMSNSFTKGGFDLGIVTTNGDDMLRFYRDVVGLEFEATVNMEALGVAAMHRVWANESLLKIVVPTKEVPAGPGGGMMGASGMRYFTLAVPDVQSALDACADAGAPIIWDRREVRPGVVVGMVEDPDGNWVEFIGE